MMIAAVHTGVHSYLAASHITAPSASTRSLLFAVGAFIIASGWLPRLGGFLLRLSGRSLGRRAVAALVSVSIAVFVGGVAYGDPVVSIAAWAAGAVLLMVLLLLRGRERRAMADLDL